MTTPTLHRGATVYRVGRTSALRAIYIKPLSGGMVELKTSIFAAKALRIRATDVFPDRDACRTEIERRKQKEPT
jgi:hypothetical protein